MTKVNYLKDELRNKEAVKTYGQIEILLDDIAAIIMRQLLQSDQ